MMLNFQDIEESIRPMAPSVKMPTNMSAMPVPKGFGYFCPQMSHYSANAPTPAVRKGH
jgi:hypothetical protein